MKLLCVFALILACAYADLDLTEWKAEYGAIPTGARIRYVAPLYPFAPEGAYKIPADYKVTYNPLELKALMEAYKIPADFKVTYDPLELKALEAYKIPARYRATYDPDHFNDIFGFYPDYKK